MAAARYDPNEEGYIPVGIEEVAREGADPAPARQKPGEQASHGINEMTTVRSGAKHTLAGLRAFEWASLLLTLSCYLSLGAVAAMAAFASGGAGSAAPLASLGGLIIGLMAFALFAGSAFFSMMGFRLSHKGRNELGPLQRKEVEAAGRFFWRGFFVLVVSAAVSAGLGLQEATPVRLANIPYALQLALIVALVGGFFAAYYFSAFFSRYLRNLSPGVGKKSRRRFRILFVLAAWLPISIVVAGAPLILLDNDYACFYDASRCGEELWTLGAPSFGPAYHLRTHLIGDVGLSPLEALAFVAGGLAGSRLLALFALRSYRKQLHTAELLLRSRIRLNAPPPVPTA